MIITISIISIIIFSCKATASCKAIELARLIFLSEFTSYVAHMRIAKTKRDPALVMNISFFLSLGYLQLPNNKPACKQNCHKLGPVALMAISEVKNV